MKRIVSMVLSIMMLIGMLNSFSGIAFASDTASDFATTYASKYQTTYQKDAVIENSALLVDGGITADEQAAGTITRTWDGMAFTFTYGQNAFKTIAEAYASANFVKDIIVLSLNSTETTKLYLTKNSRVFTPAWDTAPMNEMNDSFDAIASNGKEWTPNTEFDTKTVSVTNIFYTKTLTGVAEAYGFTITNVIGWGGEYNNFRTLDPEVPVTSVLVNSRFTSTIAVFYYKYGGTINNDTVKLKNVHVNSPYFAASGQGNPHVPANVELDGVYIPNLNESTSGQNSYFHGYSENSSVTFKNSYIAGKGVGRFCIGHANQLNNAKGTRVVTLDNNVFKHTASGGMLYLEPHDTTTLIITNNYLDKTADNGAALINSSVAVGSRITSGEPITVKFEGNKVVGYKNPINAKITNEFTPAHNFVTTAKGDDAKTAVGIAISDNNQNTGDYWLDYDMTMSSAALPLVEGSVKIGGVGAKISNTASTIEISNASKTISKADFVDYSDYNDNIDKKLGVYKSRLVKPTVTIKNSADESVDTIDASKAATYTVTVAYEGYESKTYTTTVLQSDEQKYSALTTPDSDIYDDTMVVNTKWTADQLVEGAELSYWFRGKTYTETYDANRHFNTFASAQSSFHSRFSGDALVQAVPNYIVLGTYSSAFSITYSANIYGANAGISPNDPNFVPSEAAPDAQWEMNSDWNEENATILKKSVTNAFIWTHTDAQQTAIETAGVSPVLTVDGLTYLRHGTATTDNPNNVIWFQNKGASHKTILYTANVENCMLGTRYGIVGYQSQGANFYDVNIKEVRVTDFSYNYFWDYLRNVTVERVYFDSSYVAGGTSFLWKPGNASLTVNDIPTYGDYYSKGNGGDRSVSWKFKDSMFADLTSKNPFYLAEFTDNCYHDSIKFTFEGNLFRNASTVADGLIKFGAYPNASNPTPEVVFKNNTIYDNKGDKASVIAADSSTLMAAYDLDFTGNRVIGYDALFPAFTSEMDSFLAECDWTVDNNYFASSYSAQSDMQGEVSGWLESTTATVLPVDMGSCTWYIDYNMTKEKLMLGVPAFADSITNYTVDHAKQTAFAIIEDDTTIENLTFDTNGGAVKVYSDSACETEITSVSTAQVDAAGGAKTVYVVITDGDYSETYAFTLGRLSYPSVTEWTDATGTIKAGFGVLVPDNATLVSGKYVIEWQGEHYIVNATEAFTSVADAIAAGKTQLIMPTGNYANVTITGSVEIFGNHFGQNPNVIGDDRVEDWTLNTAWEEDKTTVADFTISGDANGATIVVDGVELTNRVFDTERVAYDGVTSITFKNTLISKDTATYRYVINLSNKNNNPSTATYVNKDLFALVDSRINFDATGTNIRFFSAYTSANLTVEGTYFGKNFPFVGFLQQPLTTVDGSVNFVNNYFEQYRDGTEIDYTAIQIKGVAPHKDAVVSDGKNVLNVTGNVFKNVLVSSSTTKYGVLQFFEGGFDEVNIKNNTVISSSNNYYDFVNATVHRSEFASEDIDYSALVNITGNRLIGVTYSTASKGNENASANYHAYYTADFKTSKNGEHLVDALEGTDYYLDYACTVLASDLYLKASQVTQVNNDGKKASIIVADVDAYTPAFTNENGDVTFTAYNEKDCRTVVTKFESGRCYYLKGTKNEISVVYELYVSEGNPDAPEYTGNAYLLSDRAAKMPVGAKFSETYKDTTYIFTVGVNAFPSVSQITYAHAKNGKTTTIDIIMANGPHKGGYKVTDDINVVGDGTVLKADFDTSAVKIATIGDSVTEGSGHDKDDENGKTYPEHLQAMFDTTYGEGNYTVKNFGKENSTATPVNVTSRVNYGGSRNQYIRGSWYYSVRDYNPDVVVLMLGYNDSAVFKGANVYEQSIRDIVDGIRATGSNPQFIFSGTHYTYAGNARENLIDSVILGTLKRLADEYGAIFVDNTDVIKNPETGLPFSSYTATGATTYYADNVHLRSPGYELLAKSIKTQTEAIYSASRTVTKSDVTVDANAEVETEQVIKVAAIGDDLSYGALSYSGYHKYLQSLLGTGYEVRNYAEPKSTVVDGDTSFKVYDSSYGDIADYPASKAWAPDIAIFSFGKNDTAGDDFKTAYVNLIKEYEALGSKIYIATVLNSAVNDDIRAIATQNNWTLIDLYAVTKDWDNTMFTNTSRVLFSDKGNEAVAEYINHALTSVEFTSRDDTNDVIKNSAVAVVPAAINASAGASIVASWQGVYYSFVVGANAFATVEEALTNSNATQVIIPATETAIPINVSRSATIYGENYDVMPWVVDGDDVVKNAEWGVNGVSTVSTVTITAAATGATIKVMGIDITGRVLDNLRAASNEKTDITIENTILYKNKSTSSTEFHLANNNNLKTSDGTTTNIDVFTIKNMFFVNNAPHTDGLFFPEGQPAYFTIDGFACNDNMQTFGFPKWGKNVKAGKMTLTNSFIKNNYTSHSRYEPLIYFSGHNSNTYTDEERFAMDISIEVSNNTLIDCSNPVTTVGSSSGTTLGVIDIYPGAFKKMDITNNTFISTGDDSTRAIRWESHEAIAVNDKDFTDRITFSQNRVIGYLAAVYVNDLTEIDLSGNYFETAFDDYKFGAPGDTPADTDADTYIDFELTTKRSDMLPQSDALGLKTLMTIDTVYGYSAGNVTAFDFANEHGVTYKVYSDAACTTEITSLDVTLGNASKAYVKATKGDLELVYTLYIMGVKDMADVASAKTSIEGIDDAALYYPSLYAQPNGIEVVTYYNNEAVKFTTGENVVSSQAQFGVFGDNIVIPDDITDVTFEILTKVNFFSANEITTNLTTRKVKIACVGDSITEGSTDGQTTPGEFGYPAMMQEKLGTTDFEVKNYGQSGRTAVYTAPLKDGEERNYKKSAKTKYNNSIAFNGDIVIIGLGTNDVNWAFWTSNDRYIQQYVDLIRDYQALPSKPAVYITTATERYDSTLLITARVAENLRHIQRVVADITGAQIIDTYTIMDDLFSSEGTAYSNDKLHPNKEGYNIYGIRMADELSKTYTGASCQTVNLNNEAVFVTHAEDSETVVKANTCTEDGYTLHTCSACDESYKSDIIPATNHEGTKVVLESKEHSCTEDGLTEGLKCTACDTVLVEQQIIPASHNPVLAEKEPTCKDVGYSGRTVCSVCSEVVDEGTEIPALGHTIVIDPATEATCTQPGITEGSHCSVCNEVLVEQQTVEAKGHTIIKIDSKASTLDQAGYKEHYKCEACGIYFEDEAATKVIEDIDAWKAGDGKLEYKAAVNEATGKEYKSINEAIRAAAPGETVKLVADVTEDTVMVIPGVTLDLNGYNLTSEYFVGLQGSNVIDTDVNMDGRITVAKNNVVLSKNNEYISVYDDVNKCYLFQSVSLVSSAGNDRWSFNAETYTYEVVPRFGGTTGTGRTDYHAMFADGGATTGVDYVIRVAWTDPNGTYTATQDFKYTEEIVATYFKTTSYAGKSFLAEFTGQDHQNAAELTIYTVVKSCTGVEILSRPKVHTK